MVHAQFDPAPRSALAARAVDAKVVKNLTWQQIADTARKTPASTAAASVAWASASLTLPQSAPSCQAPSPITPTSRPIRAKLRFCTDRAYRDGCGDALTTLI